MTDDHKAEVVHDLAKLLCEAEYSDLVLICESQEFHVHQCIVCSRSPVLAAACNGQFQVPQFKTFVEIIFEYLRGTVFQEGKEKRINVTMTDRSTLQRMILYLYTGDYDDNPDHVAVGEAASSLPSADGKGNMSDSSEESNLKYSEHFIAVAM